MKRIAKVAIGALITTTGVGVAALVQAGGWANLKLQAYALTQVFHDHSRELDDLEKQNINPEETTRIELEQLLNGGPPKDGIPSIDTPEFDTAETTPFAPDDIVVGMVVNGEAKAYPYNVLNWHEIVNDEIGGVNVTVSYCPLCDTIVAFDRGETTFGVSGKLYQSCLVMYDRADDTLYAQPWGTGVVGPNVNKQVDILPAVKTTLGQWLEEYPDSQILSTRTGHARNYSGYPYGTYYTDEAIVFPVRNQDQLKLHPKTIVSYVWESDEKMPHNQFSGDSLQFVHDEVQQQGSQEAELSGRTVRARWEEQMETVVVEELDGTVIPSSTAFAFVYPAFYGE
ncbi:MAG: DUF3179 domain-containing protein [Leptolyngbya sp. SIO3F4]|nr:DUF3179 domain-containing protein [Leptolyngbya sp. SIO3F4]